MDANSSVVNQPLSIPPSVNQPAEPPSPPTPTPTEPVNPPIPPTPTPPISPTNVPVVNPESVNNPPPETTPPPKKKLQFLDKKKLATYGLAAFSFFFLSTATFFTLNMLDKNKANNNLAANLTPKETSDITKIVRPSPSPRIPFTAIAEPVVTEKGNYAFAVNDEVLSWKEYTDLKNYNYYVWRKDTNTSEFIDSIKNTLPEQLLIMGEAKKLGIQLTDQDLANAELDRFGNSVTAWVRKFPETQRLIAIQAYKTKLIEKLISWRSGGFILVRFTSQGAEEIAKEKGENPKEYFRKKIEALYGKAQEGQSFDNLRTELMQDSEIIKANVNVAQSSAFNHLYQTYPKQDIIVFEDPIFKQTLFQLKTNELSNIFVVKQPVDREKDEWIDYGYIFIMTTDGKDNQYPSYEEWLTNGLKAAKIISNI